MNMARKKKSRLLVFIAAFMMVFSAFTGTGFVKADKVYADVVANVIQVTDWNFNETDNPGGLPTVTDTKQAASSYQVPLERTYQSSFNIKWELNLGQGEGLKEGDQYSFVFMPEAEAEWGTILSAPANVTADINGNQEVIGTFIIDNGVVVITFNDKVNGLTELNNGRISTAKATTAGLTSTVDVVSSATIGAITKYVKIQRIDKTINGNPMQKGSTQSSNNLIAWYLGKELATAYDLIHSSGTTVNKFNKDYIIEDTLPAGTTDAAVMQIVGQLPYGQVGSEIGAATARGDIIKYIDVMKYFTKVEQAEGESYASFKAKVGPLNYGVHKSNAGIYTVIVNFGDYTNPNYPIKYETELGKSIEAFVNGEQPSNGFIEPGEAKVLQKGLGSNNAVSGNIVSFVAIVHQLTKPVAAETEVTNTATNSLGETATGKATLTPTEGSATAVAGEAKLIKMDADTNYAIEGATFKLQQKGAGDAWQDYNGQKTTDANGAVSYQNLPAGTYKFVEVTPAAGYIANSYTVTSTPANGEFTISDTDTKGVVVTATNAKQKFTVTYQAGAHGDFTDDTHNNVVTGSTTPAYKGAKDTSGINNGNPKAAAGYIFDGWKSSADNKVYKDNEIAQKTVTDNVTYTAQWKEKKYVVKYDLNGGLVGTESTVSDKTDVSFDATNLLHSVQPAKEGYTFTGWKVKDTTTIANNTHAYSVLAGNDRTVEFITLVAQYRKNITVGGEGSTDLQITKVLTGTEPKKAETFTFQLYDGAYTGDVAGVTAPTAAPSEVKISTADVKAGNNKAKFGALTFTQPGVYTYKLREVEGTNTVNYTYDKTVRTVKITVSENANKTELNAAVEVTGGTTTFSNAYAASESSEYSIPVTKTVTGDTPSDKDFTFTIAGEGNAPMPAATSKTVTGSNATSFSPIKYKTEGTFTYTIKETAGSDGGYSYDPSVYTVKVKTEDQNGKITVVETKTTCERAEVNDINGELAIEKVEKDTPVDAISFTNPYSPKWTAEEDMLPVDPPVEKIVEGNPSKDETFEFELKATNLENPMPEGSVDGVKTITIEGEGTGEFGTWIYKTPGTYIYTVSEVNTKAAYYKYDPSVCTITDEVTDVDGEFVLNRTVTDAYGDEVDACTFVNEYDAPKSAKTGDNMRSLLSLLIALLTLAAVVGTGAALYGRRKEVR